MRFSNVSAGGCRERDIGYEPHDILVYTNDDLKLYKSGTWVGDDFLS